MYTSDKRVSQYLQRSSIGTTVRVLKESDTELWHNSFAYHELLNFISRMSTAIQGIQRESSTYQVCTTMRNLCGIFDRMYQGLTAPTQPPLAGHVRPGPTEQYRTWSRHMLRQICRTLELALPVSKCEYIAELGQYLTGAFGNQTRIDYGTGHELSFLFFMCSLFRTQILQPEDLPAAGLMLFQSYLYVVRELQSQFKLKPAGSQGAYSLDEYQFVPYMWGVAQLCYNAPFAPKDLFDPEIREEWTKDYLLLDCVAYLERTNPGDFSSHSSNLWSLTALSSWTHIYQGLHHMYMDDVVCQFHLMRHICFGSLMSFDSAPHGTRLQRAQLGYVKKSKLSDSWDDDDDLDPSSASPLGRQQQQQQQDHKTEIVSHSGFSQH